jgi:hypothetical protein
MGQRAAAACRASRALPQPRQQPDARMAVGRPHADLLLKGARRGRAAVHDAMAALPGEVNLYEATILPNHMRC